MRLLVVSTWLPYPPDNGSRMRAFHLLRHLSRRHTITLLAFGTPQSPADLAPLRDLCERVEVVASTWGPGRQLTPRGLLSKTPRHFVQAENPALRQLVAGYLPGHTAAVAFQVEAARYLEPWRCAPRVFDEVEVTVYREQYERADRLARARYGLTWWKFRHFMRRLVNAFDRSTVVSEPEREHLRAMGCPTDRLAVVPNGIVVPEGATAALERANRVIYPGSVTYSANLDAVRFFAHEILPVVRRDRPDLQFWVTGATDGVDVSDLRRRGVTFTGRLPEVDRAIAQSAACVVPLRIGGGTRLKILHAMALATPVVSTTKGIEGLEIDPGRHVLVADSPADFVQQLLTLMGAPALAERLVVAAQSLVRERYAWGPIADTLERVIEDAVADHPSYPADPPRGARRPAR